MKEGHQASAIDRADLAGIVAGEELEVRRGPDLDPPPAGGEEVRGRRGGGPPGEGRRDTAPAGATDPDCGKKRS